MEKTDQLEVIEVGVLEEKMRLSDYAVGKFECLPSRKSVKKAIKRGILLVDGHVSETGHWVEEGETLAVVKRENRDPVFKRKLQVPIEDEDLAVVIKPADIPVSGYGLRNLQNALSYNLKPSPRPDAMALPRPVHRLDRQTGGLVIVAKTLSVAASLGTLFEEREIEKTYAVVVEGEIKHDTSADTPIEEKPAFTRINPVRSFTHPRLGKLTEALVFPETGRRNQIRIHLANMGFPILGDLKFGGKKSGKGLFLFAERLSFAHPVTGEKIEVSATLPEKFRLIGAEFGR
jgi:tRNA pseudouridine65 synthase/23S rRNA pseudouridine1911/1915/1917 synthase